MDLESVKNFTESMNLPGMENSDKAITFTRNEWKHFLDELKLRGVDKIDQCVNNARYLDNLDIADEQIKLGKVITFKNYEEFEAMTNA